MDPTNQDNDDADAQTDENGGGLKARITDAIETVKERIQEYHEQVDKPD